MNEIKIGNTLYDVVDLETYTKNRDSYLRNSTAIDCGEYILPIISDKSENTPGIIIPTKPSPISFAVLPDENTPNHDEYLRSNMIDFSSVTDMGGFIEKQQLLRNIEKDLLTSSDEYTTPDITSEDTPAMAILKQAVIDKKINLDKYESRFGSNYNNDKRLIYKSSISLPMLVRMCNNLDIKAELTLSDASPDCPNPMECVRTIELTGGGNNDEQAD